MKIIIIIISTIIATIILNSCGPSSNDVHNYVGSAEDSYYNLGTVEQLQKCNRYILYYNDNLYMDRMDSIINSAIEDINHPKDFNEANAAVNEKRKSFFAKVPYFKNLAVMFLKDYQKIVKEDLKSAAVLFQKYKNHTASLEDAENYALKMTNISNKMMQLDSNYVAKKDSFLASYGDNLSLKGKRNFSGRVNDFTNSDSNSPTDFEVHYFNETVIIIRPLQNIGMVGYRMTSGIKSNQQEMYDQFGAQIDTALIQIKFLYAKQQSYSHSVINFIEKYKNEWETNAKPMVGMNAEDAGKQWNKIKTVFDNELDTLEQKAMAYAKFHDLKFRNE